MDKRRSPRYPISLNALVHPNEGRSWLCSIQDFCETGMLLVEQGSSRSRRSMPGIEAGGMVGIHFSVPNKNKEQHFRLEGKIVRAMDSGVGINFSTGMDDNAMTELLNYSNSMLLSSTGTSAVTSKIAASPVVDEPQAAPAKPGSIKSAQAGSIKSARQVSSITPTSRTPASHPAAKSGASQPGKAASQGLDLDQEMAASPARKGPIKPAESKRIISAVRREVAKVLPEMNSAFFSYMDEELLKLARDAKTNAVQSEYFAAMSNLEKAKKSVGQSFSNEVLDQIDNPRDLDKLLDKRKAAETERKAKQAERRVKLSLVNTEEFEDWLAIANMISRSERSYEKYLQELRIRLGMLVDSWSHVEANPLGTAVFTHAFDDAIRKVDLSKEIRQKVYSGFEAKAIPLFRKLYVAVAKLLEDSQLFPDIDEDYITPMASRDRSPERGKAPEPEKKVEQTAAQKTEQKDGTEDDADELAEDFDLREELEELRNEVRGRSRSQSSGRASDGASQRRGGRGRRNSDPGNGGRKDIGQAISSLYSTVRGLVSRDAPQSDYDGDFADFDDIRELLTKMEPAALGQRQRASERLSNAAGRPIAPEVMESLGVVENLVDSIETDNMLPGSVKDWVRQLELTLDKVATESDNFLSADEPHESLEVINQLARLGGAESGSVRRDVDSIVENITRNYDSDPRVFEDALQRLNPIVEKQSRAFTGNVQRTVKASEGQQTLANAQRAVVDELNSRLTGREIPEVLLRLLMPGWRNLMVNTHLRQGENSADWQRHVQALDQVVHHIDGTASPDGTPGYMAPQELVEYIEQGLDSISFEPGQRIPLVNSLRNLLVDGGAGEPVNMVEVPKDSVAEVLGFTDVDKKEIRRSTILDEWAEKPEWDRWLDRASNLHVGDWLEFKGEEQVSIVAWCNEEATNFVFVNRRGVKTHDLMIEELAAKLAKNEAKVMEESDLPLTDRASHRMLQNMHNQLTHQASHDELTGLANRKEFERALERSIQSFKRDQATHVVAILDLDQFKVINNAAGHDAGDEMLKRISRLLEEGLADSEHVLSRLGGNEFGIVINNCAKDSGISVIRQLSDLVKANRFEWGKDVFSLTASFGVVYIDDSAEDALSVMRSADSACEAAKEAGRDRIQLFEPGDTELEKRRDIMSFVSQIDNALKEDRFVLNCQKIQPIVEGGDDHSHYEILLTVLDENDEPLPPQDFIVAAETYNRMGAIDRWVIKNSFKWIASNILKLDHLGAFSINISGNSLTEDDFMEFVLEQFNETRLPTSKICFEITETSAIGSLDDVVEFMEKMKVIGVQFSLDDFGTGLSSYSYLRNLPVDYLKIDGVFVKDIKTNPSDYAVVKSINEIGHFMGKKTIAEFVEDDEVLEILREIGVDFAQGYGIGKKIPITELLL
ncbi:MAG: diguanylate cyclase (GGDEF)-like protein [Candidatus Azotimanducaceae bacterium]|jgi:diguanylate cyclase (GGDEF)-like protein